MSVAIGSPVSRPTITKWAVNCISAYDPSRASCSVQVSFLSASDEEIAVRNVTVQNGSCEGWEIDVLGMPSSSQQTLAAGFDDLQTAMAGTGGPISNLEAYLDGTTLMP